MMKVILDVQDNKMDFAIEVLRSLSFVKNAKPISLAKVKLWENLKEAAYEVQMHKKGKIKLKTAQDLLNEL